MVLEATVLAIDNSEWMRNGDYPPSRLDAQADAVSFLFNAKTLANPENTVALLTMANKNPAVMLTLSSDIGKILNCLHNVKADGDCRVGTAIQIAQNKNQRQRIIVFIASPLTEDQKSLIKLGKKLKKNNIALDVVSFGQIEENDEKLRGLVDAVDNNNNSHLVTIHPGPRLISDVLLTSPIICGEDGPPPSGFGAAFEFGVDPTLDPELAMALKMSMEEERVRLEDTNLNTTSTPNTFTKTTSTTNVNTTSNLNTTTSVNTTDVEIDDELQAALALSMIPDEGEGDVEMKKNKDGKDGKDESKKSKQ